MADQETRVFYGWYIVAVCFVINFTVFGIAVNTFTVYVKPISADMGWSRGQFSFGLTLASLAMGIMAPLMGRIIDRTGARIVMTIGAVVIGSSFVVLSGAHSLWVFYLFYMISGAGQAGTTIVPISLVISNWFKLRRGRALGIVMTGTGIGAMVMVPLTSWIVVTWGWRTSYLIMGWVIIAMAPLALFFIKTSPSDMGLTADGGTMDKSKPLKLQGLAAVEALRSGSFWLIAFMMFILGLVGMGLGLHLMPYLTDIGHPEVTAGMLISIIAAMTVLGKVSMGMFADRWGIRKVILIACAVIIIGILILMKAETIGIAVLFAVCYGYAIGTPLMINPALTADCFGLASFGAVFGILSLFNILGAGLGAWMAGAVYDAAGSYNPVFWIFIILTAASGVSGALTRKQPGI
ncbi:MAG: MFS transporter [Desulfobacterales bacterium]